MVSLSSTRTPRSLSTELLYSRSTPSLYWCLGLIPLPDRSRAGDRGVGDAAGATRSSRANKRQPDGDVGTLLQAEVEVPTL